MKLPKQKMWESLSTLIFQEITVEIFIRISRYSQVSVCGNVLISKYEFYLIIRIVMYILFSIATCSGQQVNIYLRKRVIVQPTL